MVDAEAVKKICDIYDWDGKGELDLFFLGDVMYALGMNTTKKVCVGLGQTDEEGKKFAKFDDIVEKVNAAKNTPDSSRGDRLLALGAGLLYKPLGSANWVNSLRSSLRQN